MEPKQHGFWWRYWPATGPLIVLAVNLWLMAVNPPLPMRKKLVLLVVPIVMSAVVAGSVYLVERAAHRIRIKRIIAEWHRKGIVDD